MAFGGYSNKFSFEQQIARSYWHHYKAGGTLIRVATHKDTEGEILKNISYKYGHIYDYAGREIRPIYIRQV
jgi:hypothetical protein